MTVMRRLILFLQQSSVEWASSLWMHVVQELDPEFKRTACSLPPHLCMPVTASACHHNDMYRLMHICGLLAGMWED